MYTDRRQTPGQPATGPGGFAQAQPNTNNPGVQQQFSPGGHFAYEPKTPIDPQTKTKVKDVSIAELGVIQSMPPVNLAPSQPQLAPLPTDRTNANSTNSAGNNSFGHNGSQSQGWRSPNTLGSAPTKDIRAVPKLDFTPLEKAHANMSPNSFLEAMKQDLNPSARLDLNPTSLDSSGRIASSGRIDFNERIDQFPKADNNPFFLTPR
jgi:hypothetical protein